MFYFSSDHDKNQFTSLKGLVNKHNGVFASAKQAAFLFDRVFNGNKNYGDSEEGEIARFKKFFGVDLNFDEHPVMVNASVVWSEYRGRSAMPVSWCFILDQYGVKRMYKVRYKGNLRDGASPNPNKTELVFTRHDDVDVSHLKAEKEAIKEEAAAEAEISNYVGEVGARIEKKMTLRRRIEKDGDWGGYYMFIMNDEDGNLYFMNGGTDKFSDDGFAKVRGTVKSHFMTKQGVKATRLARPHYC